MFFLSHMKDISLSLSPHTLQSHPLRQSRHWPRHHCWQPPEPPLSLPATSVTTESCRRLEVDSELGDNITSPSLLLKLRLCFVPHNLLPPPSVEDNERANEQSLLLEPGFLSSECLFEVWFDDSFITHKCSVLVLTPRHWNPAEMCLQIGRIL